MLIRSVTFKNDISLIKYVPSKVVIVLDTVHAEQGLQVCHLRLGSGGQHGVDTVDDAGDIGGAVLDYFLLDGVVVCLLGVLVFLQRPAHQPLT